MRHRQGFTLLEVVLVLGLTTLFVVSIFSVAERLYALSLKFQMQNSLKQASGEIYGRIRKDMGPGCHSLPTRDSHGLIIESEKGTVTYRLENRALYREADKGRRKLTTFPVRDVTFVSYGQSITMNLTLAYMNTSTRKEASLKTMETFER